MEFALKLLGFIFLIGIVSCLAGAVIAWGSQDDDHGPIDPMDCDRL